MAQRFPKRKSSRLLHGRDNRVKETREMRLLKMGQTCGNQNGLLILAIQPYTVIHKLE